MSYSRKEKLYEKLSQRTTYIKFFLTKLHKE